MPIDRPERTALESILSAFCRGVREQTAAARKAGATASVPASPADDSLTLEGHVRYIDQLAASSEVFRDDDARRNHELDLARRRRAFWREIRARLEPQEIPAAEKALAALAVDWNDADPSLKGALDCGGSPARVLGEAQAGLRAK